MLFMGLADARAEEPPAIGTSVKSFVKQHCFDCHGPDLQEAGLRIDSLANNLNDADAARSWVKILDKVSTGKMPPPDEERPAQKDVREFTQGLHRSLHDASLTRQRSEGRVVLRRLNRNEYETTLRDLLGPQVEVKDLLPEDSVAAGFDNVSAALDVSAVHLLRYQQAAEGAVRSVIPAQSTKQDHNPIFRS